LESLPEKTRAGFFDCLPLMVGIAVRRINVNNAITPVLLNDIFVQCVMNNVGQSEQSRFAHASLFTWFT
jgi:hypothetical protein